ncbi:hypothetical protein ACN082_09845 [Rothia sp. CCM 9417]|uniref:hypothetical protein n=1 Tax=Rothia sp. CCM 9417 TaxID=3402657 RepID=UPI003ADD0670
MNTTFYRTWTQGTNTTWEQAHDIDPNREISLTDDQREQMNADAKEALEAAIDRELPDGVTVLGNGDIVGPYPVIPIDWEEVHEKVDASEWWEPILTRYL